MFFKKNDGSLKQLQCEDISSYPAASRFQLSFVTHHVLDKEFQK